LAKVPSDWNRSTLIRIFKKEKATEPGNWQGISFLSMPGKILSHTMLQRIRSQLDYHFRDEQYGFRPNRSCADLISMLRLLSEESREWCSKIYMIFVDFKMTFNSVDREIQWKILIHYGISEEILTIITTMFVHGES
jgi:hypothetical protein